MFRRWLAKSTSKTRNAVTPAGRVIRLLVLAPDTPVTRIDNTSTATAVQRMRPWLAPHLGFDMTEHRLPAATLDAINAIEPGFALRAWLGPDVAARTGLLAIERQPGNSGRAVRIGCLGQRGLGAVVAAPALDGIIHPAGRSSFDDDALLAATLAARAVALLGSPGDMSWIPLVTRIAAVATGGRPDPDRLTTRTLLTSWASCWLAWSKIGNSATHPDSAALALLARDPGAELTAHERGQLFMHSALLDLAACQNDLSTAEARDQTARALEAASDAADLFANARCPQAAAAADSLAHAIAARWSELAQSSSLPDDTQFPAGKSNEALAAIDRQSPWLSALLAPQRRPIQPKTINPA